MELTTSLYSHQLKGQLFMITKIQKLNGTHNSNRITCIKIHVVYDVKNTKFEWNSQLNLPVQIQC